MSTLKGDFTIDGYEVIILEEFSQENDYLLVYLSESISSEVVKFEFGLSNGSIQIDVIPFEIMSQGESLLQEIRTKDTCCPYVLESHNPILSIFTRIRFNNEIPKIQDVVVYLE